MIYARPGDSFEATISGVPTGLTGTLGVRVLDNAGGTTIARVTAGIAEFPAGSGFYAVTLTAPAAAGQYSVFWDTGSVGPSTTASEDLLVTGVIPSVSSPTGSDLTTLANVRAMLQKPTADVGQDPLIQTLITRASIAILRYTSREFAPLTPAAARSFPYKPNPKGYVDLSPYDVRNVTTVKIDTDTAAPVTLLSTQFRMYPRTKPEGVWNRLRLNVTGCGSWGERDVEVTGDWGFASVPPDVEDACIKTVLVWLRRDASGYDAGASEGVWVRPRELPTAVLPALNRYRRQLVG